MISYALKCDQGHGFDSWFQSAAAFEVLARGGHLSCSQCGSGKVSKAIMAPRIAANASKAETAPAPSTEPVLRGAPSDIEKSIAELRRKVEESAEYVGQDFTRQAREIHLGQSPERPIYGEARPDQARSLIADGVALLPLPFRPRRKMS